MGFMSTVLQCRNTKYGVSFLHIRVYNPLTNFSRWYTLNSRKFLASVGLPSIADFQKRILVREESNLSNHTILHQVSELEDLYDRFVIGLFVDDFSKHQFLDTFCHDCPEFASESVQW